jgi:hypothetical protein
MPAKNASPWTTIQLAPLSGMLDTRSRPADIPVGAWRWKQNWAVTSDGKLCRRGGHERPWPEVIPPLNHDLHEQGATREPITFQFESSDNDGVRRLFAGTRSRLYKLHDDTGVWDTIASGKGAYQSRFHAAELQNKVFFTNNVDNVISYSLPSGPVGAAGDLVGGAGITAARVVIQFKGCIILMNCIVDGKRVSSHIQWSDLNDGASWTIGDPSIANFQTLDYGDAILNAVAILDRVYIFTERSIWSMSVSSDANKVFDFTPVYRESKNQAKCLAYPNALLSTGIDVYYMGRDSIYRFSPYLAEPERPEQTQTDWMHRATGVIFRKADTVVDEDFAESPVAEYSPTTRELWFSWPGPTQNGVNNLTLVAQLDQRTADVVDTGYTSLVNFRRNPVTPGQSNEMQDFIGASGEDYCLKSIGGVFYRQFIDFGTDVTDDVTGVPTYVDVGYFSILRGMIPTGLYDREKIVRNVLVDHDTSEEQTPCAIRLRLGNAYTLVDPNDTDEVCAPQWRQFDDRALACPTPQQNSALRANGRKPAAATEWATYEQNRFLFFELTIAAANEGPAIGGDTCFQRVDFDVAGLPKP